MSVDAPIQIDALAKRFHATLLEALPRTPTELIDFGGRRFWIKREDQQTTGSFKVRGALLKLALLDRSRARFGVICASAGNHGKGVAWAASQLGIGATIVVPRDTPAVKRDGIQRFGAELIVHDAPGYDAAEQHALRLADERHAIFVSPFDDPFVQAGNGGTVALEIIEDVPTVRRVIIPVGGGGLAAGLGVTIHSIDPLVEVVGVQSEASPAMARSLRDGFPYLSWPPADTLAEGLEGGVAAGTFELCRIHLASMHEVAEASIAGAMVRAWRELGIALEGSAAVVLAAIQDEQVVADEHTVVVLTGHNVDPARLDELARRAGGV